MNQNKIVFFDIDYTLFDTAAFKESGLQTHTAYEETFLVLEKLSHIAKLGIFSEGDVEFQKNKLRQTNLEKFFGEENMFINAKKEDIIEKLTAFSDSKLFLIDDKLSILATAKKIIPSIITVWVKRGPFAAIQKPIEGFTPDKTIETLTDLFEIVSHS